MITHFYKWKHWENIMHTILFLLIIYILYLFYIDKSHRTVTNIILLTIVIAIDTLIHKN